MIASRYTSGGLLCPVCLARPCCCDEVTPELVATNDTPEPVAITHRKPSSGNAIPFALWDEVIPRYGLEPMESSVLGYLCRQTIGYGRHDGADISIAQIARGVNMSISTVQRSLSRLERAALIERTQRKVRDSRQYAPTWIRVVCFIHRG